MREAACESWLKLAGQKDFVFLTGDLGFNALEPLQSKAGKRFINAGIAEQNMVSVAAGMASVGWRPWVYSIAPFCYARPFEQIRNDVCLHHHPVQLVGNGGGFGYGVMGGTHHAVEDYGVMLALQNMRVWVPAFDEDVWPSIEAMSLSQSPGYLRLGRSEKPKDFAPPAYAPWRKLVSGNGPVVVSIGPVAGTLIEPALAYSPSRRPDVWIVNELPLTAETLPKELLSSLKVSGELIVLEEHVSQGGLGQMLIHLLSRLGVPIARFHHFHVQGYLSGFYGSQTFHRKENGLDFSHIADVIGRN